MARALRATALAAVVAFVLAAPAVADPPARDPVPSTPLAFPAGTVCPFPVLGEVTFNKQTQMTFSDGRVLIVGPFKARITNEATGESVERNAPGPIRIEQNPDGTWHVIGTGTTLFFFFAVARFFFAVDGFAFASFFIGSGSSMPTRLPSVSVKET